MSIYDSIGTVPVSNGKSIYSSLPTVTPAPAPAPVTPGPINKAIDPFIGNVIGGVEKVASDIGSALTAPAQPVTTGPVSVTGPQTTGDKIGLSAVNTYANSFNDMVSSFGTAMSTATDQHSSALEKGVDAGEAGISALNFGFAPISVFLNATSHIPVIGELSTGLNNLFGAIGAGGSDAAEGAVDALPISDETKATLMPLAKQIGALAAQVVAGKGGADTLDVVKGKTTDLLTTLSDRMAQNNPVKDSTGTAVEPNPLVKLPVNGDTTPRPLSVTDEFPTETAVTPNKGDGTSVEPITPQAPASAPGEAPLPTIQANAEEPSTAPTGNDVQTTPAPSSSTAENGPTASPAVPNEPVATSGEAIAKSASDVNTTLVKQGFDALPESEQAKYSTEEYTQVEQNVAHLMDTDPEGAKDMAAGDIPISKDLHGQGQILFNAVEAKATEEGDGATLNRLANSPYATKLSEAAQTMGEHGYNDNPNSATKIIRDVQKTREANLKAKGTDITKETAKDAQKFKAETVSKRAPRESWGEFVKKLSCNT